MYCQAFSPFVHVLLCHICVNKLSMGVRGTGLATFFTGLIIYRLQNYFMRSKMKHALVTFRVKWNDRRNLL